LDKNHQNSREDEKFYESEIDMSTNGKNELNQSRDKYESTSPYEINEQNKNDLSLNFIQTSTMFNPTTEDEILNTSTSFYTSEKTYDVLTTVEINSEQSQKTALIDGWSNVLINGSGKYDNSLDKGDHSKDFDRVNATTTMNHHQDHDHENDDDDDDDDDDHDDDEDDDDHDGDRKNMEKIINEKRKKNLKKLYEYLKQRNLSDLIEDIEMTENLKKVNVLLKETLNDLLVLFFNGAVKLEPAKESVRFGKARSLIEKMKISMDKM
jgi:hypothetical protein